MTPGLYGQEETKLSVNYPRPHQRVRDAAQQKDPTIPTDTQSLLAFLEISKQWNNRGHFTDVTSTTTHVQQQITCEVWLAAIVDSTGHKLLELSLLRDSLTHTPSLILRSPFHSSVSVPIGICLRGDRINIVLMPHVSTAVCVWWADKASLGNFLVSHTEWEPPVLQTQPFSAQYRCCYSICWTPVVFVILHRKETLEDCGILVVIWLQLFLLLKSVWLFLFPTVCFLTAQRQCSMFK